jgi:tetratricopeptide (TPR) repeat protein
MTMRPSAGAAAALALWALAACRVQRLSLSPEQLEQVYRSHFGGEHGLVVPYAIDDTTRSFFAHNTRGGLDQAGLAMSVAHAIFAKSGLGLTYDNSRTLTAIETYQAGHGNCLSFVNLFVGASRYLGVDSFYVEVSDYDTYRRDGAYVINGTHIVAGYYQGANLITVDFLPGQKKRYRRFSAVSDVRAVAHFYNNQAVEQMLRGELELARAQLQRVVVLAPDFAKGWNNLGVCLNRLGRPQEAVAAFQRAMEADSEFVLPHENLAAAYLRSGDPAAARLEIDRAKELKSRNPYFLLVQADQALQEGRLDEAEKLYDQARRRDRSLPDPFVGLGKIARARGRLDEALRQLRKALALEPDNREAKAFESELLEAADGD